MCFYCELIPDFRPRTCAHTCWPTRTSAGSHARSTAAHTPSRRRGPWNATCADTRGNAPIPVNCVAAALQSQGLLQDILNLGMRFVCLYLFGMSEFQCLLLMKIIKSIVSCNTDWEYFSFINHKFGKMPKWELIRKLLFRQFLLQNAMH